MTPKAEFKLLFVSHCEGILTLAILCATAPANHKLQEVKLLLPRLSSPSEWSFKSYQLFNKCSDIYVNIFTDLAIY